MGGAAGRGTDRVDQTALKGDERINLIKSFLTRLSPLLFGTLFLSVMAGCALSKKAEQTYDTTLPPVRLTEEEPRSKKLGKEFLVEARKQFQFVKDPEVVDAVTRIGQSILLANGEDPQTFHFLVVKENVPNAFAIPGGYIFVFDGLLSRMASIDELAGVLSHEIGHVKKDHFFKEDKKATLANIAGIVAALVTREPGAAVAGVLTAESLGLSFSREHEREADSVGLRFLNQAGYDPEGLYHFFKTLQAYEQFNPSLVPAYFSTHPAVEEREMTMQMLIRSLPPPPGDAKPVSLDWDRIRALVEIESHPNKPPADFFLDPFRKGMPGDKKHYLTALFLLKNNQLVEAVGEFGQAIKEDPRISLYHSGLAEAYFKLNRIEEAEYEAQKSLSLDSQNGEGEMILAFSDETLGEKKKAIGHLEKAKVLRERDPTIYFKLGGLYASTGNRKEAAWNLARYFRFEFQTEKALRELQKTREDFAGDRIYRERVEQEMLDILREGL